MCCEGRTFPTGGFCIDVRDDCPYFDLMAAVPAPKWRNKWFYIPVDQEVRPLFSTGKYIMKTKAWQHSLSTKEKEEASLLMVKVAGLLKTVTGLQLISTFVKRRVWPLQQRAHPLWRYEGPLDVTRMSDAALAGHVFHDHVKYITSVKPDDVASFDFSVFPFSLGTPLPEVTVQLLFSEFILLIFLCEYSCLMCLLLGCEQGHSTASTLPPLPEYGDTEETRQLAELEATNIFLLATGLSHTGETVADEEHSFQGVEEPVARCAVKRRRLCRAKASDTQPENMEEKGLEEFATPPPETGVLPPIRQLPVAATEPIIEDDHEYVLLTVLLSFCLSLYLLLHLICTAFNIRTGPLLVELILLQSGKGQLWPPLMLKLKKPKLWRWPLRRPLIRCHLLLLRLLTRRRLLPSPG